MLRRLEGRLLGGGRCTACGAEHLHVAAACKDADTREFYSCIPSAPGV